MAGGSFEIRVMAIRAGYNSRMFRSIRGTIFPRSKLLPFRPRRLPRLKLKFCCIENKKGA